MHRRLPYMPGVDGLRAFAVAAVLVYHLGAAWLPGGFLGVDVFLVISGFLITSLLLAEQRATGSIDLRRFWIRRARRLLPAVLLMLVVVLAVMVILHPEEVRRLHGQVVAALLYVVNWHFIYADVPYFGQFGRQSVLLHLWSLAIEEQFYLVWPLLLALGLLAFRRRAPLVLLVGAAAVGSTALAWVMWEPYVDPSRIYYGTDTRAVALLVGVALAFVPWAAGDRSALPAAGRRAIDVAGVLCAAGLVAVLLTLGDLDERLYRGGFLVVALLSAGVIAAVADSSSVLGRAAGWAPLVWLGLRSYGIYLWHWPVIMLTRPHEDVPFDGAALVVLRVALTIAAAALSYRFVERPFRRHGFAGVREALGRVGRPVRLAAAGSATAAVAALAVAVALAPASTPGVPGIGVASAGQAPGPSAAAQEGPRLLFVGDSVLLGATPELRRTFGRRAVVDAAVGRGFREGAAVLQGRLRRLPPDAIPVIHLGNNSFVDPADLDALLGRLADRPRVLLLTVRVPLPWQDSVNRAVRAAPQRFPNVRVVDWFAASAERGLLVDGAHMNEKGMRRYGRLLQDALSPDGPGPATATGGA